MSLFRTSKIKTIIALTMMFFAMQVARAGTPGNYKCVTWLNNTNMDRFTWLLTGYYLDANPIYNSRDITITVYQATNSITFLPGFETAVGDEFTAEIVAIGSQVQPPSSSTGSANFDINWIISKSFDENGNVIKENKAFFDNSGQPLQSQTKIKYRKDAATTYTHVFASQSVRDAMGRAALSTLPAPIDNSEFIYKPDFVRNGNGSAYDYRNFDRFNSSGTETDKTNNPDQIGSQHVQGTLGWYYSSNNNWEPYMPTTGFPYSRQTFYRDGTGNGKKSAGAGEVFKAGSGHEVSSYIMPVVDELNHYIQVRNKFFTGAELGAMPGTLKSASMLSVAMDANGRLGIVIKDKGGRALMDGRPGNDLAVSNTATVKAGDIFYFRTFLPGNVNISSANNQFYNMETEQLVSIGTGGAVAAGYYKLVNTGSSDLTINYNNSYTDVSYRFYNQLGQLVATIAPEGVKKLYGGGLNNYVTKNDIPFVTLYEYDVRGRIVKSVSVDAGTSEMVYRNDGKIRFTQNAEQKITGRYSYTNYDQLGRGIESGEYQPDGNGIQFNSDMSAAVNPMRDILDNISATGGLTTGTKRDVMITVYDIENNSHGKTNYVQNADVLGGMVSMTKKYSSIVNNAPVSSNIVSSSWCNYDIEGRLLWTIQYINGLGYKTTDYTYDVLGRLVKKTFQAGVPGEIFVHYYEFDPVTDNLWKIYANTEDVASTKKLQITYIYYLHGPLKRVELAGDLQGIDYTYTLQGNLKAINNSHKSLDPSADGSNGFSEDAFGMVLDYYTGDYNNSRVSGIQPIKGVNTAGSIATDCYAGNIKAMTWFSKKPVAAASIPGIEDPTTNVFQYDNKYQFTENTWGTGLDFSNTPATFSTTGINKEVIKNPADNTPAYDANGNILFLQRTYPQGLPDDKFTYNYLNSSTNSGSNTNYNTNKLQSIVNEVNGVPQSYASYMYDKLGHLTFENTGNISTGKYIKYDVTGKVIMVARDALFTQLVVEYVYNEFGQRIIKKSYNPSFQLSHITYYAGDVIYTQAVTNNVPANIVAQEYEIQGAGSRLGVYYRPGNIYAYELSDHVGDVRAIVAKNGSTLEVRMYTDYYPFGMVVRQGKSPEGYRYGYQGQNAEKDDETNWNAFELRMYDSKIGRWLSVDPKGEFWSPYVNVGNNPISHTDPTGGECEDCPKNPTPDMVHWHSKNGHWYYFDQGEWFSSGPPAIVSSPKTPSFVGLFWVSAPGLYGLKGALADDVGEAESLTGQTWNSLTGKRQTILAGSMIDDIKKDPGMMARERLLVQMAKADKESYGVEDFTFEYTGKPVGFGGEKGAGNWDRFYMGNPMLKAATWKVAGNRLTWSLRNATVKATVQVHKDGGIHIEYELHDTFDLSWQEGRPTLYNVISEVGGFFYHTIGGGNKNMVVRAFWGSSYY